ncbi:MAG: lipopolysaccharide assembly protein LapA domain-containing protein [Brachybacterium sp.]|uniref:LapA family protein n=1 Tax=Brachybacterium sp. TaxID=1891286 RepID=UPI00265172FC|nr:lipopolysaccharide assembly protein LapA domain-containing protein [Brachybacterium sp.]MDN6400088.1 lipopolysaccharide assembly protein LapA domain-containing protein [Brachybacterium sp.]
MTASDDPTRPTASTGGNDATRPDAPAAKDSPPTGRRAAERPAQESQPVQETRPAPEPQPVEEPMASGGKTAGMWIGLILGAIILVLLLIFVIQNNVTAGFQYFGAEFDLPLGVAMLLAAIAGALVMALVGSVRMIQMSWTIRKLRKQQDKIHRATR